MAVQTISLSIRTGSGRALPSSMIGLPQRQGLLAQHSLIVPKLYGIHAGPWKWAISDAERQTKHMQWIIAEGNGVWWGGKDEFARFLPRACNAQLPDTA
jgi:hypothetical protein